MDSIRSLVYPQVGVAVDKGATANKCGVTGNLASALRWVAGTLLFAMVLLCSQRANAQNTGTIFGSVQDPTGAVIPGASVVVADATHGVSRTVTSNGAGEYTVSQLPIGVYTLTVSSPTLWSMPTQISKNS
jgi:hypothetical protein